MCLDKNADTEYTGVVKKVLQTYQCQGDSMLVAVLAIVILWPVSSLIVYGLYKGHLLRRIKEGRQGKFSFLRHEAQARFFACIGPASILPLIVFITIRSLRSRTNQLGWAWDIPCKYRVFPIHSEHEPCEDCAERIAQLEQLVLS